MLKIAGFEENRDRQMVNMIEDGMRICWDEQKYKQGNKCADKTNGKPILDTKGRMEGLEIKWLEDLWNDAKIGTRVIMTQGDEINKVADAYPTTISAVAKTLPDRTKSDEVRFVQDQRPNNLVAEKTAYKKPHLPTHEETAEDIIKKHIEINRANKWDTEHVQMVKLDESKAFKRIKVNPLDTGATVAAASLGDTYNVIATASGAMVFGHGGAPGIFSYHSETIVAFIRHHGITAQMFVDDIAIMEKPDREDMDAISVDNVVTNLYDPVFQEFIGNKPHKKEALEKARTILNSSLESARKENWTELEAIKKRNYSWTITEASYFVALLMKHTLGKSVINIGKSLAEASPSTEQIMWGIAFDTKNLIISLPPPKLEQYGCMMDRVEWSLGYTYHLRRLIQSARGQGQWFSIVAPALRPILRSFDKLMSYDPPKKPREMTSQEWETSGKKYEAPLFLTRPSKYTEEEWITMYDNLFETIAIMQGITQFEVKPSKWTQSSMESALSWERKWDLARQGILNPKITVVATDASHKYAGAYNYTKETRWRIPVDILMTVFNKEWNHHPQDDNIAFIEFMVLAIAITHEVQQDSEEWYVFGCDNMAAVAWMNKEKANPPQIQKILRNLLLTIAERKAKVNVVYIRSGANIEADLLSRKYDVTRDLEAEEIPLEIILKAAKQLSTSTPVRSFLKAINPNVKISLQQSLCFDCFPTKELDFRSREEWDNAIKDEVKGKLLEMTNDMPSFAGWEEMGGDYKHIKVQYLKESDLKYVDVLMPHLPSSKAVSNTPRYLTTQWTEAIKGTDHIKDIMVFDEFNRRCVEELELDLQAAGWATQKFPIFGVEDGSKFYTRVNCIWAHRSPTRHDTLSFNVGWLYSKKIEHDIKSYDVSKWKTNMFSEKHIFAQDKTWSPATPIKVGQVTSTPKGEVSLREQQTVIYDEMGPLPLNILSTVQESPPMRHTITIKKQNGRIESIPPTELNKWIPQNARLTNKGVPSYGHRPWLTSHSVQNRINAIKLRQRRDKLHMRNAENTKITVNIGGGEVRTNRSEHDPHEWELTVEGKDVNEEHVQASQTIDV